MDESLLQWLLAADPWVEYRTRLDLLDEDPESAPVQAARARMLAHAQVRGIVDGLQDFPGDVINSHKSAGQSFHRLSFLADLGLTAADPGIRPILDRILAHPSEQGPFQLPAKIAIAFGGDGTEKWAWALCDAPLLTGSLVRMGLGEDERVQKSIQYLAGLGRENGWPCAVSPELGKFRGPGRKDDPCPFANLIMLKLLIAAGRAESLPVQQGAEAALQAWAQRETSHAYMFYMGTDFCKLKAPLVWYDLLNVLDVLSAIPALCSDARLLDMAAVLRAKMNSEGRFTAESVWTWWKDWEFGQKKVPSAWITLLAWRILRRMGLAT